MSSIPFAWRPPGDNTIALCAFQGFFPQGFFFLGLGLFHVFLEFLEGFNLCLFGGIILCTRSFHLRAVFSALVAPFLSLWGVALFPSGWNYPGPFNHPGRFPTFFAAFSPGVFPAKPPCLGAGPEGSGPPGNFGGQLVERWSLGRHNSWGGGKHFSQRPPGAAHRR